MFRRIIIFATIMALPLLIGCGKAPDTEMQNADTAMKAAQDAQADQYAQNAYQAALDTLNAAMAAKEEQDSKFALFRSYGDAQKLYASAQALAEQAASQAAAEKERMQTEAAALKDEVQALLESANKALASAPRAKGSKADIELLKNELAAAQTSFDGAAKDYESGDFIAAKVKLEAVKAKAETVIGDIQKARSKKK